MAEFFWDSHFFEIGQEAGNNWRSIIFALMNFDKDRFVEVIGKFEENNSQFHSSL